MKTFNLKNLTPNPSNPRVLRDDQYKKLLASIKRDPEFLSKRPVVHADNIILGGNMRYRALLEATRDTEFRERIGTKKAGEVPASWVLDASEFTEEQRRRSCKLHAHRVGAGRIRTEALSRPDGTIRRIRSAHDTDLGVARPPVGGDGGGGERFRLRRVLHRRERGEIGAALEAPGFEVDTADIDCEASEADQHDAAHRRKYGYATVAGAQKAERLHQKPPIRMVAFREMVGGGAGISV